MGRISRAVLLGLFLLCAVQVDGYSKYGRSCKDIGCRSNEICVMAEDPCTLYSRNECGRYPTCTRTGDGGGLSCTTKICPPGQYCKTENGQPTCVNTNPNLAPAARRPGGRRRRPVAVPRQEIPTAPPRSSSYGQGGRYSGGSFGNNVWNRGSSGLGTDGNRLGNRDQPINTYGGGRNHYQTHTSKDAQVDQYPPVLDIFAENNGGENRDIFRRQDTGVNAEPASGGTKTSGSSGYPAGSGYPSSGSGYPSSGSGYPSSGSGYPSRTSSGYPAGSGYPSGSDSPTKTSSTGVNSAYPSTSGSGYPSGSSGSGYPSGSSSGYPSGSSSGYPARSPSGSSGYPSGSSSGYPARSPSSSGGYPSGSGYPSSTGSGYPSQSSSGGYPGSSGYPSSPDESLRRTSATSVNSGYPSYPSNTGYPSGGNGQSRYPSSGSYPAYPSNGSPDGAVRRTSASSVNAGYPNSGGGYPSSGGYQASGGYPGGGYPAQNQGQSARNNYPGQSNGSPASGGYPGQYGQYNNGGQGQYPGSYQQPSGPGYYDNQRYPNGYPGNGGAYQTTKKPTITEQIANYAKNLAQKVLTQTIIDKVSGRN